MAVITRPVPVVRVTLRVLGLEVVDLELTTDTDSTGEPLYELQALVRLEARNRQAARRHAYANLATRLTPGA